MDMRLYIITYFKHPWAATFVHVNSQLILITAFWRGNIVTHCYILLHTITSVCILEQWPSCCDSELWKFVHTNFRFVLLPAFWKWFSNWLSHMVVQHLSLSIIELWRLCCDLDFGKFVHVKSQVVLMPKFWKWI